MEAEVERADWKSDERWVPIVRQLLKGLRYGVVQIVVQDSKVIQVEKTEKLRLPAEQ